MAQAKKVKPGQVWTAKVSGKPTQVEIVGETTSSAGGRTRFLWKNLNTGRTSAGGAGKLHDLVRDAAPAAGGAPTPAPAPRTATRRPPPRPASFGHAPAAPRAPAPPADRPWFKPHPSLAEQATERGAAIKSLGWTPEDGTAAGRYAATTGEMLRWGRESAAPVPVVPPALNRPGASLPSLRSTRPATAPPTRTNPKHYPSPVARSAAEAISRSNAQSPRDVAQVIQAWAYSFAPPQVAPPSSYGVPPGFNPYQPRPF
jgi:hypothetical protein